MKQYVIKKSDLIHNVEVIKQRCGGKKVIAVLKGNGYGLGIVEFAKVLKEAGINFFAVSEVFEAVKLRESGVEDDILLLTATCDRDDIRRCLENDVILSAGSVDAFDRIFDIAGQLGKTARVHLKIDTGFGRFGFNPDEIDIAAECVKKYDNIETAGVFSHLSYSFSEKDEPCENQYRIFCQCIEKLKEKGVDISLKHICNSCGALRYPHMHMDAVRVGSALLGRLPLTDNFSLKRIGFMRSDVIETKILPKGSNIGYANTYKTKKDTRIAVIPVGYKDGFGVEKSRDTFRFMDTLRYMYHDFKSLGKKNTVEINGKVCNIIGRISMYNIIADVTGTDVKRGDAVKMNANPILVSSEVERVWE